MNVSGPTPWSVVPRLDAATAESWRGADGRLTNPLVIVGGLKSVPALTKWSLEHLAEVAGSQPVMLEHSVRSVFRPDQRVNRGLYQRDLVDFASGLEAIAGRHDGLHHYLSNVNLAKWLPCLTEEVPAPPVLAALGRLRGTYLFAGPATTGSHAHYDTTDNAVAVFSGRKHIVVFPPGQLRAYRALPAYHALCHFSGGPVGYNGWLEWAAAAGHPGMECRLGPGDLLVIPAHWWHFVRNEELTLGVTYSFAIPMHRRMHWRHARVALSARLNSISGSVASARQWAITVAGPLMKSDRMRHNTAMEHDDSRDVASPLDASGRMEIVPLEYVFQHARRNGGLGFARAAARAYLIENEATRQGLVPDEAMIQSAADIFRRNQGLETAAATIEWLASSGLTIDDFESHIRTDLLEKLVRDELVSGRVDAFIDQSPEAAESVIVSRIRHRDRGVLAEIIAIEADGERDFHALARQCSEDVATAPAGGYVGRLSLAELPVAIHDAIRQSQPGDVVGPVVDAGIWAIFLVEEFESALSPAARERAERILFERWMDQQLARVQIELLGDIL